MACFAAGCQESGTDPITQTGDGRLGVGILAGVEKIYPDIRHQLCWVHMAANVVSKLPDRLGQEANHQLRLMGMAETRADADKAYDLFVETYQDKYPSAVECLKKDRGRLPTFYYFPAKHWPPIRTSNPIESIFSTVRLRRNKTRNNASRAACLAMIYKLGRVCRAGISAAQWIGITAGCRRWNYLRRRS